MSLKSENSNNSFFLYLLNSLSIYFSQDTEFPGVVARPIGDFRSSADYQYQLLRCNVDLLKIIQVGITFLDDFGQTASPISTWQFNFKFNLTLVFVSLFIFHSLLFKYQDFLILEF